MKKTVVATLMLMLMLALTTKAMAWGHNYVEPAQFKQWLETGKKVAIVDIQVPAEFQQHHFRGALETNAFPAKSAEDHVKLDRVIPRLAAGREEIVIVCPRGGGGAKNTYAYLKEKGIAEKRMFILREGMQGWPYQELVVTGK
ncbi:MAG TPA: rhodanese-like domain-containing protein [Geomonas sp.]|nr:rhodanese-like domain-containing protein [Geomonas sp.]